MHRIHGISHTTYQQVAYRNSQNCLTTYGVPNSVDSIIAMRQPVAATKFRVFCAFCVR